MNVITLPVTKDLDTCSSLATGVFETGVLADVSSTSVPLKPTAAMLADGSRAGGVTVEVAWRIYQAMLRAAS